MSRVDEALRRASGRAGIDSIEEADSRVVRVEEFPAEDRRTAAVSARKRHATLEPVLATERRKTEYFSVDKGYALGLRQSARGLMSGQEVLRLDLEMTLGAPDAHDSIEIEGQPPRRSNLLLAI